MTGIMLQSSHCILPEVKADVVNSGIVTINGKVVHLIKNGQPLKAGDLIVGQCIKFDLLTGEVLK